MTLIKLTYNNVQWTTDWKKLQIRSEPKSTFINVDCIASISSEPTLGFDGDKSVNLYYVKTFIPNGRGLNGVDYSSYYVDEKTYKLLVKKLDIIF